MMASPSQHGIWAQMAGAHGSDFLSVCIYIHTHTYICYVTRLITDREQRDRNNPGSITGQPLKINKLYGTNKVLTAHVVLIAQLRRHSSLGCMLLGSHDSLDQVLSSSPLKMREDQTPSFFLCALIVDFLRVLVI